jgi:hypothetical protein
MRPQRTGYGQEHAAQKADKKSGVNRLPQIFLLSSTIKPGRQDVGANG